MDTLNYWRLLVKRFWDICFHESRFMSVWMKLEKLDVFSKTKSVGIELVQEIISRSFKKKKKLISTKIKK